MYVVDVYTCASTTCMCMLVGARRSTPWEVDTLCIGGVHPLLEGSPEG